MTKTASHLAAVTPTTTDSLTVGAVVIFSGRRQEVTELTDLGTFPLFGTGTNWTVTLVDESGRRSPMVAPTSQRWQRVA
jgi:hypothetical protein